MKIQDRLNLDKDKIINDYNNGVGTSTLAKIYKCNSGTIWFFLKKHNVNIKAISSNYGKTKKYLEDIKKYLEEGLSAGEISKKINITVSTICKFIKENGLVNNHKRDERKIPLKTYTKKIISLYKSGLSLNQIAEKYICSSISVLAILRKNKIELRPIAKYTYDKNLFKEINNEESAYILGFFYADGNVKQKNAGIRLSICDLEILEKIKEIFKYTGPIYSRGKKSEKHQEQYELSINSKELGDQFCRLGCMPNKTFQLKFPEQDIVPNHLLRHFLRGYWDGDGGHGKYGKKYKRWQGCVLGTRSMIDGYRKELNIHGYLYQRFPKRGKDNWSLLISKKELKSTLDFLYKDSIIFLKRKYDKYLEFLSEYEEIKESCIGV